MVITVKSPNLIYILADDMGYGDVSCLNPNAAFKTHNFDKLGKEGAIFTDAHSASAVCTPSRYSILTGRYNWRSRLKSGVLGGFSPTLIEPKRQTIAHLLKKQGYTTACVGKWHLGMDWAIKGNGKLIEEPNFGAVPDVDYSAPIQNGPNKAGFDYYYGISASLDMPPYVYIENEHVIELPDHCYEGVLPNDGDKPAPKTARPGPCAPNFSHEDVLPQLTKKALEVIEEVKDSSFFLYFPLPAPHTPILPTEAFQGKSSTNSYGDFCLMCDDVVGQIMKKLNTLGIEENTILIYASDNGCSPQVDLGQLAACGHDPSCGFRGHKADIYEGGHRIPLLIRWPCEITPHTKINQTVCLSDLMATMAEILNVKLPDNMGEDSVSNLPLFKGKNVSVREATVHQSIDGSLSLRKGNLKLEMCVGSGGWSYPRPGQDNTETMPKFQLYNLDEDPVEQHNIIEQLPQDAAQMRTLLLKYVRDGRSTPGTPQANNGAAIWETVRWIEE